MCAHTLTLLISICNSSPKVAHFVGYFYFKKGCASVRSDI